MIIYLLIELEPTGKFNERNDLLINKMMTKFWTFWVWEFSGIFLCHVLSFVVSIFLLNWIQRENLIRKVDY
jgi:hypothetical protein